MNSYASRQVKTKIRILAYYQIIGGVLGLSLAILLFKSSSEITAKTNMVLLATAGLYFFSIYCGLLLNRGSLTKGLNMSLINQGMQVISLGMFGYAYKFVAGIAVTLGINLTDEFLVKTSLNFSEFQIHFYSNTGLLYLNVNVMAVYLIYLIQKIQAQLEEDRLLKTGQIVS